MRRRAFLAGGLIAMSLSKVAGAAEGGVPSARRDGPLLDGHIHLFDATRPEGVPWPAPEDAIHGRALADDYFPLARPLGVVGALVVEASPWRQDNFWLLDVVRGDPRLVGFVGNLEPGEAHFAADLERLAADPLFCGTRYGNLWGRDLGVGLQRPAFVADLGRLAESGRVLESANPDPGLIVALLRLSDRLPELRIVVDHLPNARVPAAVERSYRRDLAELAQRRQVFMKLSEIPCREDDGRADAPVRFDLAYHRARLDGLWELFGEDRIVFGSDWPNSEHLGSLAQTVALSRAYLAGKPEQARRKVFYLNSRRVYRWSPRCPEQP
ncbi:Amidohydrolase 2 [Azotobacter vinelandii CA]|uniref:Amidohydrolase 2 n=2 Tax=Azotobacter vinelandii TaxID=354 RepID=C1DMX7_AZOVD|nr:amidohydrolase family protein [Azotobacter vinelandii]ACO77157.1 Amidohydrolase 2 [Azotobacter vinelandii DJ]AGK15467.1 Amidohydrolase 2 [Azotobacter vinelandii CA]AGK19596.1 Amidohydrolase 2 [Azotobacter vinelandii CA6]WKN22875.1 amidohydrolase family protein [Azotobacter vinelandii]